ncbi:Receptor-type tyrosine-protein phosphatase S [Camelus dromedarius]|uniref:Receptor-type tyrosine-protein phosphatase S n=1 Tax=Camelus dromedarius TaxID=9838 RepID=A0A5N4CK95_CAMDR|nr:Receptor-type tyrosine-protein phosphatase S [Camelus dromedarius]
MLSANHHDHQWEEPVEPNGLIRGYRIYYTTEPEHPVGNWQKHNVDDSLLTTVGSLLQDETYTVRVLAFTSVGDGPLSDPIQVKTQQGGGVSVESAEKRIVFVFSIGSESAGQPMNSGPRPSRRQHRALVEPPAAGEHRQVRAAFREGDHGREVGRTFDPATTFVVDDLKPNTEYAFRWRRAPRRAWRLHLGGAAAHAAVLEPSAPPQDVKCVSTRSTAILVSWRPPPPETHNGALVSYSVRYRPLGSEDPQPKEVNGIPPTTTQILLEALDKWTEYRITAVAHTEVGPGPESSPVVVRTDEDVPSAPPRKVEAEALNATAIASAVRSPAPGAADGQSGYQVHYVRRRALGPGRRASRTSCWPMPSMGRRVGSPGCITDPPHPCPQEMVITNLQPETAYSITVAAYTMKGDGARSKPKVVVTKGAVLGRPTLSVQQTPEGSLLARWEPPAGTFEDQVLGYRLQFGREDSSPLATLEFPPTEDHYTASGVHKGATYVFRLAARSRGGLGEEAAEVLSIPEDTPRGHPQILEAAGNASAGTVLLRWLPPVPAERNGAIVKYTVAVREAGALGPARETELPAAAERAPRTCSRCRASSPTRPMTSKCGPTRAGPRPYSPPVRYRTFLRDQVSPKNFKVKMIMKTSVLLSWEFPDNYNSPTPYKIQYNGLTLDVDGRTTKKLITHLKPNTFYNFVLTNRGSSLGGLQQTVTAWTAFNLLSSKPSVTPKPDSDGFIVVNYFIVMVPLRKSRGGQFLTPLGSPEDMDLEELIQDIARLQRRSLRHSRQLEVPRPYIAARFSVLPPTFHPGDQKQYGGFDNRGLEPGHRYVLFVLAVLQKSEPTFAASPFSDPFQLDNPDPQPIVDGEEGLIWVIGPVLAVVFIICIVIAILLYKNKRKDSEPRTKCLLNNADLAPHHPKDPVEMRRINFQTPGMLSHPPIPIADMAEHTERLKANDSLKLSQEYESIDPGQQFTWEHSNLEVNKPKNRYANVIAYDHSRVILQPIEGIVGSDYINANYVDGYRRQNAYIATQGPLPETFGDFWRMVWEQRSATIVMMTRLEEKSRIKCDQYWPNRGTETYGFIQVTLLDTIELATFCVRTFSLHKNGSSEKREVRQFQFTAWPDHGVPEYPTPFLAFLRRVKTCNPPDAGPIVVHCSAGVGRTGCFIVIDAMLERIKPEKTVDVYGHVTLMRSQRNYMVQTEDQYSFIHEALLEAVGCGNTEVPARSLYAYIQKLAQVEPGEHVTGMELEFKRLANSKAHTSRFISANLPCNKFKNRLVNIMPYESTRVCLQPIRGVEGSDYINASFIDGYRQQKAYIATQGPLAESTEDFWRMLWENNSTIVVMLTKLREMGREKCHQYWPAERSARYQYFVVDPMAEYNMPQYILREFKVTDARDGQSRTVRQFQFTDWPEQGVPKSGEGFIDFIGQVHKTKEQFGQDGPISVHCSAGVGRTGVFITLSIVLERMRYEGVVDIFQTVKMLRTQRPAMVQTEDEYQFCYQAALEYLGSFDHYATEPVRAAPPCRLSRPPGSLLARWEPAGTFEDQVWATDLQFGRVGLVTSGTIEFPPHEDHTQHQAAHGASLLSFSRSPLPGTVLTQELKVKMIMKTSVLLSWSSRQLNSPTPYKVRPPNRVRGGETTSLYGATTTWRSTRERLKANDSLKLSQEYESIDPGQRSTGGNTNLEVNKPKDRYASHRLDHSRVISQPSKEGFQEGGPGGTSPGGQSAPVTLASHPAAGIVGSDYINANYVMATAAERLHCHAGPLPEPLVTSGIKCDQYWPTGTETYGFIQVTLLDHHRLATFCVRDLLPDKVGPQVRTGGCRSEKTVDVYGHVTSCGPAQHMVQDAGPVRFIHEALLEAVGCGNTEVPARSPSRYIQKLAQVEPGEHVTGMELEFKHGEEGGQPGCITDPPHLPKEMVITNLQPETA